MAVANMFYLAGSQAPGLGEFRALLDIRLSRLLGPYRRSPGSEGQVTWGM